MIALSPETKFEMCFPLKKGDLEDSDGFWNSVGLGTILPPCYLQYSGHIFRCSLLLLIASYFFSEL